MFLKKFKKCKESKIITKTKNNDIEAYFVSGVMRSGTTILQRIVAKSLSVDIVGEFDSINVIVNSFATLTHYQTFSQISREQYLELYREFFSNIFKVYADNTNQNKFVFKDPLAIGNIEFFFELLSNVKFIISVRDPRATFASIYRVRNNQKNEGINSFISNMDDKNLIDFVSKNNKLIMKIHKKSQPNLYCCKYENLVTKDVNTITDLSNFLGCEVIFDVPHFQHGDKAFWTPVSGKDVSDSRISAYSDTPEELIAEIKNSNSKYMKYFSYC